MLEVERESVLGEEKGWRASTSWRFRYHARCPKPGPGILHDVMLLFMLPFIRVNGYKSKIEF